MKLLREKCNPVTAGFVFQYTINGKKVEVAVKQIIAGKEVEQRGAFSNPETLDLYQNIPELQNFWSHVFKGCFMHLSLFCVCFVYTNTVCKEKALFNTSGSFKRKRNISWSALWKAWVKLSSLLLLQYAIRPGVFSSLEGGTCLFWFLYIYIWQMCCFWLDPNQ